MKKAIIGGLAAGIGAVAAAGDIMYNIAIKSRMNKSFVFESKSNRITENVFEGLDLESIPFKDVWTASKHDGLTLHGSILENDKSVFVITLHMYSMNTGKMMYAKTSGYLNRGYSMLYPDMRGQGESAGNYIGMGWHDRMDILSWIDYLNRNYDNPKIILYGISMGGAAVMMAAGENLPSNVKCIIEDCGFVSAEEELKYQAKSMFKLPYFPVVWAGSLITKIRANWTFGEANALPGLTKSKVPILFIHGDKDTFVPLENVYLAYNACASEKEILIIPDAGHTLCQETDTDTYWTQVLEFIDKNLD